MICASLMCFRPLLVKLFPIIFQSTKTESNHTPNPSWGGILSTKLGSKLRTGNNGIELSSADGLDEEPSRKQKEIRVQTTWVTETTVKGSLERGPWEELGERGGSQGALCHSDSS